MEDFTFGLVLSGGGMRGVAHIGLLQALREKGLHPSYISGSSAGALVGALYGAGLDSKEMLRFFDDAPLWQISYFTFYKTGMLDTHRFGDYLKKFFPTDDFSSLKVHLYVTATDLLAGDIKVFNTGPLMKPLLASAAAPGIFSPVEIDNSLYVDGGVMDNFPVKPLRNKVDIIIGSYVNPIEFSEWNYFKSTFKVTMRASDLKYYATAQPKFALCDFMLEYNGLKNIGWLSTDKIQEAFEIGYQTTLKQIDEIKATIQRQAYQPPT